MRTTSRRFVGVLAGLTTLAISASTGVGVAAEPDAALALPEPVKVVPADDAFPIIWFGDAVDVDGNTMVVGAQCAFSEGGDCDGAAYVFVRSGSTWTQQAKLLPADLAKFDRFGSTVAISGDTVVIGSPHDSTTGVAYRHGSAYVFTRANGVWTERVKLTIPVLDDYDELGDSVAIDGGTVVVGAPFQDIAGQLPTGAAYVFERDGRRWPLQAELRAADRDYDEHFAASVAVEGDTVIAGAPFDDSDLGPASGAAYAFVRTGTAWQQTAQIVPTDLGAFNYFGGAVALDGGTAAIGNGWEGELTRSAVYVFNGAGSTWTQQAKLTGRGGTERDEFGSSLDLSGDTIVVGAPADDGVAFDQGAAYVYKRNDTTWRQRARLTATTPEIGGDFGHDVAVDGRTVAVGHRGQDEVYVYQR